MEVKKHFDKIGFKAVDKVTGFVGVISSISFDLYGCIQYALTPPVGENNKYPDGRWFDYTRLNVKGRKPVMEVPQFIFGVPPKGAAEKPRYSK